MDALYKLTLENMERTLLLLSSCVPAPQQVPMADSFVFRYSEKSIHQAIIQKLARIVSGLHAARILLERGFIQEQAALQRMLDEFEEDVTFLSYGVISDQLTDLHREYLAAFYEEEFDSPENTIESTQKRPMVSRKKVQAYLARIDGSGIDTSRAVAVTRTIHKAYSGYVHGASPHIMEMYGGYPPRFHVSGLRGSPLYSDHRDDLWNYFYRGICAFGFAAKAFGDEKLFANILQFRNEFAEKSRKAADISLPPKIKGK